MNLVLPYGKFLPVSTATLTLPLYVYAIVSVLIILIIYGGLGYLGMFLSRKLGFPDLIDEKVNNKQRFLIPAYLGAASGFILIIGDLIFSKFNGIGRFIHPPFPTSIVASISAGIGEEIIFRLFFISFWFWLLHKVIFQGKFKNQIFWVVAVLSALAFAAGHFPAVMLIYGFKTFSALPLGLIAEIIILNSLIGLVCAYYFRKYGYLAAVGVHFWADIIWHVVWGAIGILI